MKQLKELLQEIHDNNFVLEGELKEKVKNIACVTSEGARVFHPIFGLGTVKSTFGNVWATVEFDNLKAKIEKKKNEYAKTGAYYFGGSATRNVHWTKLMSIQLLIEKESK